MKYSLQTDLCVWLLNMYIMNENAFILFEIMSCSDIT